MIISVSIYSNIDGYSRPEEHKVAPNDPKSVQSSDDSQKQVMLILRRKR